MTVDRLTCLGVTWDHIGRKKIFKIGIERKMKNRKTLGYREKKDMETLGYKEKKDRETLGWSEKKDKTLG